MTQMGNIIRSLPYNESIGASQKLSEQNELEEFDIEPARCDFVINEKIIDYSLD